MPTYTPEWSDLQLNYTLERDYSLGVSTYYREGSDHSATFVVSQFNYLLKRWNELDSQANLYLSLGLGGRIGAEDDASPAGYAAFEADYETRRIYTLFGAETLQSEEDVDFNRLRYRFGVAPYKAPIEHLQTWIIGQVDYMPEMDDELTVTPLLRFFYNNYALEIGSSVEGDVFVAAMIHY